MFNHVDRLSHADFDSKNNAVHILEKGTAYAKPGECGEANACAYPKSICKARVGKLMYALIDL